MLFPWCSFLLYRTLVLIDDSLVGFSCIEDTRFFFLLSGSFLGSWFALLHRHGYIDCLRITVPPVENSCPGLTEKVDSVNNIGQRNRVL